MVTNERGEKDGTGEVRLVGWNCDVIYLERRWLYCLRENSYPYFSNEMGPQ